MTKLTTTSSLMRGLDLRFMEDAEFGRLITTDTDQLRVTLGGKRLLLDGDYSYENGRLSGEIVTIGVQSLNQSGRITTMHFTDLGFDGAELLGMIETGNGNDLLDALLSGNDRLNGSKWRDRIDGGDGNDTILGGAGNDTLNGGNGNDRLQGGTGRDLLQGGNGADKLEGKFGDDLLRGNAGADYLLGGGGDDTLEGGAGNDRLRGGAGNDAFVFRGDFGKDVIGDFSRDDRIALDDRFWADGRDAADIVEQFATRKGDGILLEMGDNAVFVHGMTNLEDFADRLRTIDQVFGE
ncbi:calcium-binding protein [Gemmobacter serpentinus]|uniref:calcium-binding protein n=1 Tax=Gemmobacter serpentinus TaxID=2652247 RepID=UPI00186575B2|nr:calcium-binding protein [Gemmobacter serpentinus]